MIACYQEWTIDKLVTLMAGVQTQSDLRVTFGFVLNAVSFLKTYMAVGRLWLKRRGLRGEISVAGPQTQWMTHFSILKNPDLSPCA